MSRAASTPFAVLGLLGLAPMSGYEIRKEISTSIGYFWSESYGQIYPALRDLAQRGLIQPEKAAPKTGRERRRYAITAKGRRALDAWRALPPKPATVRNELLLKLFFGAGGAGRPGGPESPGGPEGPEIEWLERLIEEESARLRAFRGIRRGLTQERSGHPSLPYWLAVLSYGERRSATTRRWARETIAILRRAPARPREGDPR